ncbi:MAG TPA: TonB-dependent receptor [Sphingopyxis sp.]|nr:TonB-dependent receptor [Sphingopyxis sp.]
MKLKALIGTSALAMVVATPAYAQGSGATDENIIIVTATLRAANVQDIPIAVTAVSPDELQRQNVQDIRTLGSITPSFNLQSSQSETQGTSIRIRGVGTTGNNTGLESSVGVFIDGVYQSRPGVALGDLLDIERLEILRGPQGTLFGRNTSAGALNITTKRPSLTKVEGFVNASYGNFDYYGVQAGVSAPLIENTLGVRVAGAYRKRDGTLKSVNGDFESSNRDRMILRGQMLWEPSADISLRVIGDYAETDENCCSAVVLRETELRDMGAFAAYGLPADGGVGASGPLALRKMRSNDMGFSNKTKQWGISGELKWGLGENAELTYIGAYRQFKAKSTQDSFVGLDNYHVAPITMTNGETPQGGRNRTMSHELRLQGSAFNDKLDWLVGGYYSTEKIREIQSMSLGADYQAYASTQLFGALNSPTGAPLGAFLGTLGPNPLFALTRLAQASSLAGIGATTGIDSNGSYGINRFTQDAENWSIFTHNTFHITDNISLTLGARYVDEKKDGTFKQLEASSAACNAFVNGFQNLRNNLSALGVPGSPTDYTSVTTLNQLAGGAVGLSCFPFATQVSTANPMLLPASALVPREFDRTFKDDELTYTGQIAYNNNAGFLTYASFSHGFKSGGFNLDPASASIKSGGDPRFKSEKVDSYELGIKSSLLDNRVTANLAVFHMNMTDFQVLEFTGTQFQTFNVAKAKSTGAELELLGRFHPYMTVNLAVAYTDARYPNGCDKGAPAGVLATVQTLCGQQLTNAPKWAGVTGVTYDGPLNSSGWGLLANVNVNYSGKRRTSTTPTETEVQDPVNNPNGPLIALPYDWQEDYFKINARLGFTTPDDKFTFEIWGTNLSNEITRGITANAPLRGGNGMRGRIAFPEEPRTYGVTVRSRF